ncbi:hypothetical protein IW262DRAFT_1294966 [Armillaria fumosa]|nr:hypothetical protein IW262DRAFT_1294966 [Armillaria fumosa]
MGSSQEPHRTPIYMGIFHASKPDIPIFKESRINEDQAKAGFHHQPGHDVESVGWCIIAFCLRSQPEPKNGEEDSLEELRNAREVLSQSGSPDISPEHGFLQPPPPDDHQHEAFQRLLLNQIHEIAEDIELDTEIFREVPGVRQQEHRGMITPFKSSLVNFSIKFSVDETADKEINIE